MSVRRRRDVAWSVFGVGALFMATALRRLWLDPELAWWTPFAVWLVLVGAGFLVSRRWLRDVE